jgi:hypothetical protein
LNAFVGISFTIITYIWIMQTTQVQCRLEVKGVLLKTFPLLPNWGRFVLNMKKWKYTNDITSARSLNDITSARSLNNMAACDLITNVSTVVGHRAISVLPYLWDQGIN